MAEPERPVAAPAKVLSRQRTAEAAVVLAATRIARAFLGVIVQLLVAWRFGTTRLSDAFFAAEGISLDLAGWLGPVLKVSLIPGLTSIRLRRGPREESAAAAEVLGASIPLFLAGTLAVFLFASPIIRLTAPGFDPERHAEAVRLARILAPAFFLAGFFEFVECVLNAQRHFARPAVGRVLAKLGNIAGIVWLAGRFGVTGVVIGVLIGNVIQLVPQLPLAARVAPRWWVPRFRIREDLRPYVMLLGPALLWLAIDQVNVVVDRAFASLLEPGKLSAIRYAVSLTQFATNILVGSLISASLPSFSEHMAEKRGDDTRRLIGVNLRMVLFVTLPTMAAMVILREPLVRAFFQRGEFDPAATHDTALALLGFAIGMAPLSVNMVCRVALFTNHRVSTVLRVGALEIFTNAGLDALFMRLFGHWGIPLATSVSAAIACVFLVRAVSRDFGRIVDGDLLRTLWKSVVATGIMSGAILALQPAARALARAGAPGGESVVMLAVPVLAGVVAYLVAARVLRIAELERVLRTARQRSRK